jgi:pimeloyl-ACP methyl ester carboxylesterase
MSADGVPIAYEDNGEGSPALVLVHGWSSDRRYWSEQVGPLSVEHRVVTIDLGGHGESGLGRGSWTIASFGADVAAVVEHLGLDSVVLIGHSMGGDVIFQAARILPGKVDALVMVDTYKQLDVIRSDADIDEIVAQFSADFPVVTEKFVRSFFPANADPALVDWVATDMASAPPHVGLSAIRSSFQHAREIPNLIRELKVPILAINPDDAPTDFDSMNKYEVKVKIMRDVGHFLMMEDPIRFNSLLLEAVDEVQ